MSEKGRVKIKRLIQDIIPPVSRNFSDVSDIRKRSYNLSAFTFLRRMVSISLVFIFVSYPLVRVFAESDAVISSEDIVESGYSVTDSSEAIQQDLNIGSDTETSDDSQSENATELVLEDNKNFEVEISETESEDNISSNINVVEEESTNVVDNTSDLVASDSQDLEFEDSNSDGGVNQEEDGQLSNPGSAGGDILDYESEDFDDSPVDDSSDNWNPALARQQILDEIFSELQVSSLEELKNKVFIADKSLEAENVYLDKLKPASVSSDIYISKDDEGGDNEVFMKIGEDVSNITNNGVEDGSVAWDMKKENIVWQSLIDGRWQIHYYNVLQKNRAEVTNSFSNNINPAVQGGIVVWQGWVNDNWEIFVGQYDISNQYSSPSWNIRQITDNYFHDMFPKVAGNTVVWQAYQSNKWQVFAYDLSTEKLIQISSGESDNENPRLAVVWESKNYDGTISNVAYDFSEGKRIDLKTETSNDSDHSENPMPFIPDADGALPMVTPQLVPAIASKSDSGEGLDDIE